MAEGPHPQIRKATTRNTTIGPVAVTVPVALTAGDAALIHVALRKYAESLPADNPVRTSCREIQSLLVGAFGDEITVLLG